MMIRLRLYSIILTMFFMLCFLPQGYSQTIPPIINYSGTLTDTIGTPVPDGNYDIEFKIYNVASGGVALWTEKWDSTTSQVTVVNGTFNVMLGNFTSIPASFFEDNPTAFLGIKVGTDSEMLPRQQITSVAYTFTAGNGIPRGGIIMWSGTVANIPSGWALCDGTNGTPDLRDRFIVGAGSSYGEGQTGGASSINLSHTHTTQAHVHTATTNVTGNHNHSGTTDGMHFPDWNNFRTYPAYDDLNSTQANHKHTFTTNTTGNHSHTFANDAAGAGNTSSSLSSQQSILPPYYALAFIMKL